jgi:hypothetical protein
MPDSRDGFNFGLSLMGPSVVCEFLTVLATSLRFVLTRVWSQMKTTRKMPDSRDGFNFGLSLMGFSPSLSFCNVAAHCHNSFLVPNENNTQDARFP